MLILPPRGPSRGRSVAFADPTLRYHSKKAFDLDVPLKANPLQIMN